MLFIRDMLALARVTIRWLSILILAPAFVAIAVWFIARHEVMDWLVHRGLYETPTTQATYEVLDVRTDRVVLGSFAIDGLLWVDRIEIDFSPRKVLGGRVETVTISGAVLQVALDQSGTPTGPANDWMTLLGQGNNGAPDTRPPFDAIVFDNSVVDVVAPSLHARLTINGSIHNSLVALDGAGTWEAETTFGTALGSFSLSAPYNGAPPKMAFQVNDGELGYMETVAQGVEGTVEITAGEVPELQANLNAQTLLHDRQSMKGFEFDASVSGSGTMGTLALGDETSLFSAALTASVPALSPGERAEVSGWIEIGEDLHLPMHQGLMVEAPAHLTFDLSGETIAPPETVTLHELARALDLEGSMALSGRGLRIEELVSMGETELAFQVNLHEGEMLAVLDGPGRVHDLVVTTNEETHEILATFAGRNYDLDLADGGVRLGLNATEGGWFAEPRFQATLRGGENLDGALSLNGTAFWDLSGFLQTLSVSSLELDLEGDLLPGRAEGSLHVDGQGGGGTEDFEGLLNVEGRFDSLSWKDISATGAEADLPVTLVFRDGELRGVVHPVALIRAETVSAGNLDIAGLLMEWPLMFSLTNEDLQVYLSDTGWIDVESLCHPNIALNQTASIKLEPEHLPNLVIERPGQDVTWDVRLKLEPSDISATIYDNAGQQISTVAGQTPRMGIRFGSLGINHLQGTMETSNGNLRLLGPDVRLADIQLLVTYNDGLSTWPQITAEIRRVEDLNEPARFAPLVADANISPVWPVGHDLRISGNIHMQDRRYLANIEASYEPDTNRYQVLIRIPPVKFEPGGGQPVDVSPLYGALLEDAEGSFEILGELEFANGNSTADITLFLHNLSGRNGDIVISGLNGEITLTEVGPWRTPPNQRLTAESLDVGVPLTDLSVVLSLPGDDSLLIELGRAQFAGGSVSLGPSSLRLGPDENRVALDVKGVDLATLLAYATVPDLEINARLSGSLPITIVGDDIAINHGHLESESAGTLRYVPTGSDVPLDLEEDNLNLVLNALSNFQFSKLAMDINKPLGETTDLSLHIAGANPELHDGYPIKLNVNVTGDLDKIARDSLAGWRISEELEERLSGF